MALIPLFEEDNFFDRLHNEMQAVMHPMRMTTRERVLPTIAVDFMETSDSYKLKADIPGFNKDDINVSVDKSGVLSISAERKSEKEVKTDKYHRQERSYGKVERRLALPENANAAEVAASYNDGVLQLIFPKQSPPATTRRIRI
jgi:HSP20 family protein